MQIEIWSRVQEDAAIRNENTKSRLAYDPGSVPAAASDGLGFRGKIPRCSQA
jgi:hypothetical protein